MTHWNALEDGQFRSEVRSFFEQCYPPALRYPTHRLRWAEIRDWYLTLSKKGWLAPMWPVEYGGMSLSPSKLLIYLEEQERWGVAGTPDIGLTIVGPLLIKHGTPRQKDYYLPRILAGEHIWCQPCSELFTGADQLHVEASAVSPSGHFLVNGTKTWSSPAQDATHILLLVRTDPVGSSKPGAISCLLIDRASPGVLIRPIRDLSGQEEYCEASFDNVRVPRENIVGEIQQGWVIANSLLGFENITLGSPQQSHYALGRLESIARQQGLLDDLAFLDKFTALQLDVADLASLYAQFAANVMRGEALGPDVALLRIWATETYSRLADLIVEAAGSAGAITGRIEFGAEFIEVLPIFYHARLASICGGGNDFLRKFIAREVLHLPA